MDNRMIDTRARDIAKAYGYSVDGENTSEPNRAIATIKGMDVALAMPSNSPQFATAIPPETPLEQIKKGDRVDVYKRGTAERALMYGIVHDVNLPFGEVHLQSEHGLRSLNINDYCFVKLASAPNGMLGNLTGGQSGTAGW